MFRPFGRCALAPPCAPRALPAKSCLSWLPRFHPPGPNQLLPPLSPLLSLFPRRIWWPLLPIPLPQPLPLPLQFLLPPLPLRTLLPPLPPPRLHHRPRILRPLALSCILLFPPVTPSPSPVSSHTRSHSNPPGASLPPPPAPLLPLRQVAGAEGLAQVHVPFSLQDLAQIEAKLGSFSSNPAQYIKQFTGLTRAYALTWQDLYVILGSATTPEERQAIWTAAKAQADQQHYANPSPEHPPGAQAVPDTDPDWNYQERGGGQLRVRYMIECILDGMETSSHKVVNLLKLDEVTQGPDKNPAMFLNRLTEALVQYTRLSPESPIGLATLANRFISQSARDIRKKLAKAEDGPQIPI